MMSHYKGVACLDNLDLVNGVEMCLYADWNELSPVLVCAPKGGSGPWDPPQQIHECLHVWQTGFPLFYWKKIQGLFQDFPGPP